MASTPQEQFQSHLDGFDNAMLVTRAADGQLRSRPMALATAEPSSNLWFVTSNDSGKVDEIEANPEVCVTMQGGGKFLSLSGRATFSRDRTKIEELWNEAWKVWFPEGKNDPSLILIHVAATEGEYWDNSGISGLKYMFEAGKAYLAGERPEIGDDMNQKVAL